MALREASWQGRAEGMDIDRSHELRDSRNFKVGGLRKKVQRGELPPLLSDASNNAVSIFFLILSFSFIFVSKTLFILCNVVIYSVFFVCLCFLKLLIDLTE